MLRRISRPVKQQIQAGLLNINRRKIRLISRQKTAKKIYKRENNNQNVFKKSMTFLKRIIKALEAVKRVGHKKNPY